MKPTLDHCTDQPLQEQRLPPPHFLNGGKTNPCLPEDKGHLRILLSQAASDHLTATGESAFLIAGRASHPDDPTRWALHLASCPMATASAACEVATGARKPGKLIVTPEVTRGRAHVDPGVDGGVLADHGDTTLEATLAPVLSAAYSKNPTRVPSLPSPGAHM